VNKKNGHPPTHYPSPKRKKKRKKEKKKDQNHSEVEEGDFVRKKIHGNLFYGHVMLVY
jgi:hypothetical protein